MANFNLFGMVTAIDADDFHVVVVAAPRAADNVDAAMTLQRGRSSTFDGARKERERIAQDLVASLKGKGHTVQRVEFH